LTHCFVNAACPLHAGVGQDIDARTKNSIFDCHRRYVAPSCSRRSGLSDAAGGDPGGCEDDRQQIPWFDQRDSHQLTAHARRDNHNQSSGEPDQVGGS